jgi:hypothetical protein
MNKTVINSIKMKCVYLVVSLLVLTSCEKGIDDSELTTIQKDLPVFKEIELHSVFNVYLIQDTVYSIRIVGSEDFAKQTVFKVVDNVLRLENDFRLKWLRPEDNKVSLYISCDSLEKITAVQTCYIETVNPIKSDEIGVVFMSKLNQAQLELECNTFYYWNNFPCGGRLTLSGTTEKLKISNYALVSVDASNLLAYNAIVSNSSLGICEVRVINRLEYSIYGEGDIYAYGKPDQVIAGEITSSGRLVYK